MGDDLRASLYSFDLVQRRARSRSAFRQGTGSTRDQGRHRGRWPDGEPVGNALRSTFAGPGGDDRSRSERLTPVSDACMQTSMRSQPEDASRRTRRVGSRAWSPEAATSLRSPVRNSFWKPSSKIRQEGGIRRDRGRRLRDLHPGNEHVLAVGDRHGRRFTPPRARRWFSLQPRRRHAAARVRVRRSQ